jgi:tetratricopeptide (TPR) repeat protein
MISNRRTNLLFLLVMVICIAPPPCSAVTKIALFPLVNKAKDKSLDWIGALVPEYFFRQMRYYVDIQVLAPTFLFPVDSMGWTMGSDSLLRVHWNRWGWNACSGGDFFVENGRIICEMKSLFLNNNKSLRKIITASAPADSVGTLCLSLFTQYMSFVGYNLTKEEYRTLARPLTQSARAWATYAAGYGFEMRNNAPAALTSYARAVEMAPSFSYAHYRMARLMRMSGAITGAREMFEKAVVDNAPDIVAAAADFYVELDLPDKALNFVKKNQGLLEKTPEGIAAIGKSLLLSGELQRAIAMLTRAVAAGPVDLEPDFVLGKAYMSAGEFSKACDVFNRLVRYRPDNTRYYALLGAAYRNSGRFMESLRVLEFCHRSDPDNIPVLVNLAQTYIGLSWYDKARQLLSYAKDRNPDVPDLYVNLGVLAWYMGRYDEANGLLAKASRMGKNMQSALNNEANILFLGGNTAQALDKYRKADKIGAKNEAVLANLANAYLALNQLDNAALSYEAVLALAPTRLDILEKLAMVAEKRKKNADAVVYYRKIIELDPHKEDALVKLVDLMIGQGQFKEAVDPVEAYLNDFPNDKKILHLQAELYRFMGWYEVAIMKYQALTRDFPNDGDGFLGLGKSMFDLIRYKNGRDYDKTIYILKTAAGLDRADPEPEYIMGIIYMDYKGYPDLAKEQWKTALAKAVDPELKKKIVDLLEKAGK